MTDDDTYDRIVVRLVTLTKRILFMTNRKRCSDDEFLEAVYSSSTYAEISDKTGQKISTTMARYIRTRNALAEQGVHLPKMERKKPVRADNIEKMVAKARLLQDHYSE